MFWLNLIVGIQFLGFRITLVRLAYDEWQQWHISQKAAKADQVLSDFDSVEVADRSPNNERPLSHTSNERRSNNLHEVAFGARFPMDEGRAITAAWASDAHAVKSVRTLGHLPVTPAPVTQFSIVGAPMKLNSAQGAANDDDPPPFPRLVRSGKHRYSEKAA